MVSTAQGDLNDQCRFKYTRGLIMGPSKKVCLTLGNPHVSPAVDLLRVRLQGLGFRALAS